MEVDDDRKQIARLYQKLLLRHSGPRDVRDADLEEAYKRAVCLLGAELEWTHYQHFELRLRLALHFAPQLAIAFDPKSPHSRRLLIRDYLVKEHGRSRGEAEDLAVHVARILNAYDEKRGSVRAYYPALLSIQGRKCAHCNIQLITSPGKMPSPVPVSVRLKDPYKPVHLAPFELLAPEVDHIVPVSKLGGNNPENLQILCRFCNEGKGDFLGFDLRREAGYAGEDVCDIPRRFRAEMHYYVLERDGGCVFCSVKIEREKTIRKIVNDGGFVRSNLHTVCVRCV